MVGIEGLIYQWELLSAVLVLHLGQLGKLRGQNVEGLLKDWFDESHFLFWEKNNGPMISVLFLIPCFHFYW